MTKSITLSGTNLTLAMLDNENGLSRNYIQVSKANVSSIQFVIDGKMIAQRDYDSAQMTVKRCKDSTIIATQTLSSENIKFSLKEWTANEYYIEISCHSSMFENSTFCYSLYLNLME